VCSDNKSTKNNKKTIQLRAKSKPIKFKYSVYSLIYAAVILALTAPNNAFAESALKNSTQKSISRVKDDQQTPLHSEDREAKVIERIEIIGQINTGLMESEIALAETSSPDLRSQLSQLPSVSVNGNGLVSGIVQYRGLFGDRIWTPPVLQPPFNYY